MKTKLIATTLFVLAAVAGPASAQYLKPGLWQASTTTGNKAAGGGGDAMAGYVARMKKEMATMDPESRKAMEEMLANLAANEVEYTGDGMRAKFCISKDDVQSLDSLVKREGGCTSQHSPLTGGQIRLNVSCTNPPSTGSAVIKLQGDTGYTIDSTMTMTHAGQRVTQTATSTGKWLSGNCGKVKPASAQH